MNAILGLDVGSENLKMVIADKSETGRIRLLSSFVVPSRGMRKGIIVDMEAASSEIRSAIEKAKQVAKGCSNNIYLNIGGSDVKTQISKGIVGVSRASSEIHRDDIERVVEIARGINLPPNRDIIHAINKEYIVDGTAVENPLGMSGARLEVVSLLIDAFKPNVKNLIKCVELAGGNVSALIFSPIASALAVLTKSQKELGVILVDIGYGTTGIAVYEEGKLIHTKMFPVGAGHVTNDLGVALKIPVDIAEQIKISYGYAVSSDVSAKDHIELKKIDSTLKGTPSRKYISQVVESRLSEICDLIRGELKEIGREGKLPGGVVITGGGAKLPGIVELFKSELKLSAKIGLPGHSLFEAGPPETVELLESPEYACVLGLIIWGMAEMPESKKFAGMTGIASKALDYIKNFLP